MRLAWGAALTAAFLTASCGGPATAPETGPAAPPAPPAAPAPGPYEAHRQKFVDLYLKKDYEAALREATAALEAAPGQREAYMLVSKTFIDSGRDADGVSFFAGLAPKFPDRGEPWFFKGFHEARLGRWQDAQASFEKAVATAPTDADAHFRYGQVLGQNGQVDRAVVELQRAHELDPRSAAKAAALMVALSMEGKDTDADKIAADLLRSAPDSPETQYAVAQLRMRQKKWADAEKALRRTVELAPTFAPAHADLARLLAATGRKTEAEQEMARAKAPGPTPSGK